ncbi:MAG: sugar porter family MFS transporter [Mobilicoccus sp.]|nr:sugar porter family MFS transporter [Mobilicoccus sp.]
MSSAPADRSTTKGGLLAGTGFVYSFGALGGLNWGYDTGVIGAAMLFIQPDFDLSSAGVSAVVTFLIVGAIIGAAVGGKMSDAYGRRMVLILTAVTFILGPLGMALAPNTEVLIASRFVAGIGAGLAAVVLPVYLSEIAPARIRGAVTAFYALAIVTGQFIGFGVGAIFAPAGDWRMMLGLSLIPSFLFAIGLIWVWETPRWLVQKGRHDEAKATLLRDRTPEEAASEYEDILDADRVSREAAASQWQAIREDWVRPILILGLGLALFQQIMGINTIMYYAPITLTEVGFGDAAATIANVGIGFMNVVAVLLAIRFADRLGRRKLLLLGAVGTTVSLAILAGTNLLLPAPDGLGPVGFITLACMAAYIFLFQMTWGSILWVVLGEIFPIGVRALAMGIATTLLWIGNGIVSAAFPPALEAFGVGALFAVFAVLCALAFAFTYALLPETKGRSLEAIEQQFRAKANA